MEARHQVRSALGGRLAPAARSSDSLVGGDVLEVLVGELLEVLLAVSDGLGVAAEQGGDIVEAAMPELGRLDGGVAAPVVLAERPVEDLHGVLDIRGIGKGNGHGFGPPSRESGISPIILANGADSGKLIPRRSLIRGIREIRGWISDFSPPWMRLGRAVSICGFLSAGDILGLLGPRTGTFLNHRDGRETWARFLSFSPPPETAGFGRAQPRVARPSDPSDDGPGAGRGGPDRRECERPG